MENGTLSASDVAMLANNGNDFANGWGGMIWLFAILALFGGGGFGWGGNGNAVNADMQRGFDAQNSAGNQREILSAVNQNFRDTSSVVTDKYSELQRDIGNIAVGQANNGTTLAECCGNMRLEFANKMADMGAAIAQNRYEAALANAQTNANITASNQKVLDMLQQNKIEALQAQVNQLQLAQATSGMLKFPNSWTYGAGFFPPMFPCNCKTATEGSGT